MKRDPRIARITDPKRILVTTDFSEAAGFAYPYGCALAKAAGATLYLGHVSTLYHDPFAPIQSTPNFPEYADHIEREAESRLQSLAVGVDAGLVLERRIIRAATAAKGIIDFAADEAIDLIVISTHGYGALAQLILGSVARAVTHSSPCPVLCVKRGESGMLANDGNLSIRRVLIPVDMSSEAGEALDIGAGLAKKHGAEAEALYVVHSEVPPLFQMTGVSSVFQLDLEMRNRVTEHLSDFVSGRDLPVTVATTIQEGSPHWEIARYAEETAADIVVVSRRGHGGTPHPLGSVPERLLHDVHCPMLLI